MSSREDDQTWLRALLSQHMPATLWDNEEEVARIVCSCGSRAYYRSHLVTLILDRLHGEELAEWERGLLDDIERRSRLRVVGPNNDGGAA